jgi:hypothetical protein
MPGSRPSKGLSKVPKRRPVGFSRLFQRPFEGLYRAFEGFAKRPCNIIHSKNMWRFLICFVNRNWPRMGPTFKLLAAFQEAFWNLGGILGGPITECWGRSPNIPLYLF